jgi:hypothetical protein
VLRKILVGVAAAVGLVVGALALIVAMRPSEFRIERSTTIAAPAGKGAVFAWAGNSKVGEGLSSSSWRWTRPSAVGSRRVWPA